MPVSFDHYLKQGMPQVSGLLVVPKTPPRCPKCKVFFFRRMIMDKESKKVLHEVREKEQETGNRGPIAIRISYQKALYTALSQRLRLAVAVRLEACQEVARHLEAQPARGHAGRDLEQVGHDALVQAADTFLADDDAHGVKDGLVLVAHAGHGVDLESSSQDVAVVALEEPVKL
jgi:hypothetical protein